MKNMNNGTTPSGTITPGFLEEVTDEIKCISYTISAIGDSVSATGVPADHEVLCQTLNRLSWKLDAVAEMLETGSADLEEGEQDE